MGVTLISGTHTIIYSQDAEADRAFFRDILGFPNIDVGDGWLIFSLPPSEVAFHPAEANGMHAFYLVLTDIHDFIAKMENHQIVCAPIEAQGWGLLTSITLPGGGRLGAYQPRHARPPSQ